MVRSAAETPEGTVTVIASRAAGSSGSQEGSGGTGKPAVCGNLMKLFKTVVQHGLGVVVVLPSVCSQIDTDQSAAVSGRK